MRMTKEDQAAFERIYTGTNIAESWGFSTVETVSGAFEYVSQVCESLSKVGIKTARNWLLKPKTN